LGSLKSFTGWKEEEDMDEKPTKEELEPVFQQIKDLKGVEAVPCSPPQTRECKEGHTWQIQRMIKSKTGSVFGSMSWTEGSLNCPKCGGIAIKSVNEEWNDDERRTTETDTKPE
jgi:hypothetical protein